MVKPFRNPLAILVVFGFSILVYSRYSKEKQITQPKTVLDTSQESQVFKTSMMQRAVPD